MALLVKGQVKQVLGNSDFTLTAPAGQSFRVRDIRVAKPATSYLTVKLGQYTAGYWRVDGVLGNHLSFANGNAQHSHDIVTGAGAAGDQTSFADLTDAGASTILTKALGGAAASTTYYKAMQQLATAWPGGMTLLEYLTRAGLFSGYPIPEGQKMTLSGVKQAGAVVEVTYDIYDGADVKATEPNGTESSIQEYVNYGNSGASITASGDNKFDTMVNPGEFVGFPWQAVVPSKNRIEVHGLLGSTFSPKENDGTNYINQNYVKLVRDQTVLFDEDLNGLLFYDLAATVRGHMDRVGEGYSKIGNYSDRDYQPPLRFDPPLVFEEGEEFNIYMNVTKTASGQAIATDEQELAVILRKTRL